MSELAQRNVGEFDEFVLQPEYAIEPEQRQPAAQKVAQGKQPKKQVCGLTAHQREKHQVKQAENEKYPEAQRRREKLQPEQTLEIPPPRRSGAQRDQGDGPGIRIDERKARRGRVAEAKHVITRSGGVGFE